MFISRSISAPPAKTLTGSNGSNVLARQNTFGSSTK